jgi:hypothetical protein
MPQSRAQFFRERVFCHRFYNRFAERLPSGCRAAAERLPSEKELK